MCKTCSQSMSSRLKSHTGEWNAYAEMEIRLFEKTVFWPDTSKIWHDTHLLCVHIIRCACLFAISTSCSIECIRENYTFYLQDSTCSSIWMSGQNEGLLTRTCKHAKWSEIGQWPPVISTSAVKSPDNGHIGSYSVVLCRGVSYHQFWVAWGCMEVVLNSEWPLWEIPL